MKWNQIAQSKKFKSLDLDGQQQTRDRYFDDFIAPKAEQAGRDVEETRSQFMEKVGGAERPGFLSNAVRLAGESAGDLMGDLMQFTEKAGDYLNENVSNPGGLVWDDGIIPSYKNAHEFAKLKENGLDNFASTAGQGLKDLELGGESRHNPDAIKAKWKEGDKLGVAGESAAFIAESFIESAPHMAATVASLPLYVTSFATGMGEKRAINKGKPESDLGDIAEAAPFALGVALLERIVPSGVFSSLTGKAKREAVQKVGAEAMKAANTSVKAAIAKGVAGEALTEFVQEGILEYVGERLGTDAKMKVSEAVESGAWAALAGAGGGGAMGGVKGLADSARDRRNRIEQEARKQESELANDSSIEDQLGNLNAELANEEVLSLQKLDADPLIVFPDGSIGYQSEIDEAGMNSAASQHPAYPGNAPIQTEGDAFQEGSPSLDVAEPKSAIDDNGFFDINAFLAEGKAEAEAKKQAEVELAYTQNEPSTVVDPEQYAIDEAAGLPLEFLGKKLKGRADDLQAKAIQNATPPPNTAMADALKASMGDATAADIGQETFKNQQVQKFKEQRGLDSAKKTKRPAWMKVDTQKDDIMTAISKLGGLNMEEARSQGIDKAHFGDKRGRNNPFRAKGKTLDAMAEELSQYGYVSENYTANDLLDKVSSSLSGEKHYTPDGQEHAIELELIQRNEDQAMRALDEKDSSPLSLGYDVEAVKADTTLSEEVKLDEKAATLARIITDAEKSGVPLDYMAKVDLRGLNAYQAAGKLLAEKQNYLGANDAGLQSREHGRTHQGDQEAGFEQNAIPGFDEGPTATETRGPATEEELDALFGAKSRPQKPLLESHTEEDLQSRDVKEKAAKDKEKRQAIKTEQDEKVNDFVLTGSDLPSDQAAARGQDDMFSSAVRPKPKPEIEAQDIDAKKYITNNKIEILKDLNLEVDRERSKNKKLKNRKSLDVVSIRGRVTKKHNLKATGFDEADIILGKALMPALGMGSVMGGQKLSGVDVSKAIGIELDKALGIQSPEDIDAQANEAATSPLNDKPEPTEKQKESGRYAKGHIEVQDLAIAIENPRGSTRSGTDPNGKQWAVEMKHHYGEIKKTEGADGDAVDVFVGSEPESEKVFVVDQVNADGTFDEHKVMLGFSSKLKARNGYKSNYDKGWKVGPITKMDMGEFKAWLNHADTTQPINKELKKLIGPSEALVYAKAITPNPNHSVDVNEMVKPSSSDHIPDTGKMVRHPWEMTSSEWKEARESVRPDSAFSKPSKADKSRAVSDAKRLSDLLFDVRKEDQDRLKDASSGKIAMTSQEAEEILDRINTPVTHRDVIEKAIRDGKPVSKEILNEYGLSAKGDSTKGKESSVKDNKSYGAKNKLVSTERAEILRKKLRSKIQNELRSGIDPEILAMGAELAVYHIEAGVRKFSDVAKTIASDLEVDVAKIKPYLRSWYNGARDMMEDHGYNVEDMSTTEQVRNDLKALSSDPVTATQPEAKTLDALINENIDNLTDNHKVKSLLSEYHGVPVAKVSQEMVKDAQEHLELALVKRARGVVRDGESDKGIYDNLVELYGKQPNLNVRSSTSMENQAYSTPAPLAFVASRMAGINDDTTVYEPTAGNGMLLLGASEGRAHANELDVNRAENLKKLGFKVTSNDGSTYKPSESFDSAIMNPPFGNLDRFGHPKIVGVDGYNIKKIDHLITAKALESLGDNGRASIIIGADKKEGFIGPGDRVFFNWLYSNYNVVDHFEVNGDLYRRQGAGWPVRVITVNGRVESQTFAPKSGSIERLNNWDEIYEHFENALDAVSARVDGITNDRVKPSEKTEGLSANGKHDAVKDSGLNSGANKRGSDAGARTGASNTKPRVNDDGQIGATTPNDGRGTTNDADAHGRPQEKPTKDTSSRDQGESKGTDVREPNDESVKQPKRAIVGGASQYQSEYKAVSGGFNQGVLTPKNMAEATQLALGKIEKEVGNLDKYVMDKLGYSSKEELYKAFMGLQIDTIAAEIYNTENNDRGIIIADQTGVGKGRQAAGIIRYAIRNGYTPVFVTVKPNLYSDMYNDSLDIGNSDIAPFITNNQGGIKHGDDTLFQSKGVALKNGLNSIIETGQLPKGRNALFTTYDQLKLAKNNIRREAIKSLNKPFFVLDESHNASGQEFTEIKEDGIKKKSLTAAGFMSESLKANPVTYLSATYAKRPDNISLYHRTDLMDAVDTKQELIDAMTSGGVPLQQVASSMLAANGQLFRRERSFDGIAIPVQVDKTNVKEQERVSDEVNKALRSISAASDAFAYFYEENQDQFEPPGGSTRLAGNRAGDSAGSVNPFSSVVHNFIRQLLLGLKVETAAKQAIELHEKGVKPVIAFESTLGSFLNNYATRNNLQDGDVVDFGYQDILSVALERSRRVSFKDAKGNSLPLQVELSQLDGATRNAYDSAQETIDSVDLSDLPASPVDYWINELTNAGMNVSEITGRTYRLDYSGPKPVLRKRTIKEISDRRGVIDGFNNGDVDSLLLNVAGSTGLSIHASQGFKDQKPRHMIVAQSMLDINVLMQMLGRINRTGQVELPSYTLMSLDLPAEKRPMANTSAKLAKLNANTSSNDKSDSSFEAPDFLNKYGDQVVQEWLNDSENSAVRRATGMPLAAEDSKAMPDTASRFTGRLAVLPVKTQRETYDQILQAYKEKIEYLDAVGQNDLVAQTLDLQAEIIESQIVHEGKDPNSVFAGHTTLHKVSAKYLGKPPNSKDVIKGIKAATKNTTPEAVAQKLIDKKEKDNFKKTLNARYDKHSSDYAAAQKAHDDYARKDSHDPKKSEKLLKKVSSAELAMEQANKALKEYSENQRTVSLAISDTFKIGNRVRLDTGDEVVVGVVVGVKDSHKKGVGSPWAKSKTKITFMVNSGIRQVTLPLNNLDIKSGIFLEKLQSSGLDGLESIFDETLNVDRRELRYIATGNLFAGTSKLEGSKVVSFTDNEGRIQQGLIMPRSFGKKGEFKQGKAVSNVVVRDPKLLAKYLLQGGEYSNVGAFNSDKSVKVSENRAGELEISVPLSNKSKGPASIKLDADLRAVVGDFYGKSKIAKAVIPKGKEGKALSALMQLTSLNIPSTLRGGLVKVGGDPAPSAELSFDGVNIQSKPASNLKTIDSGTDKTSSSETKEPAPKNRFINMDSVHSKNGNDLFIANLDGDMGDNYDSLNAAAKKHGGFYIRAKLRSYYKPKDGGKVEGTPTFSFGLEEGRAAFIKDAGPIMANANENGTLLYSKYSKKSSGKGVTLEEAEQVRDEFIKKYPGVGARDTVRVYRDEERAFGPDSGIEVKGGFYEESGHIILIASRLSDRADALATLQHEAFAHKGLGFFDQKEVDKALNLIHQAALDDPKVRDVWADIGERYGDEPKHIQLEEVLASIAEKLNTSKWGRVYNKVLLTVKKFFMKVGMIKKSAGIAELRDVLYQTVDAFERGDSPNLRSINSPKGVMFSKARPSEQDQATSEGLESLGLGKKSHPKVKDKIKDLLSLDRKAISERIYEGVFDGLSGIERAERNSGKGIEAGDYEGSGYVGARLATGIADMMHAIMHYGAPKWGDGVVEYKEGTQGLLDIFANLGNDLDSWLGWMGGNRGAELMTEGRENNLTEEEIKALQALSKGKEKAFEKAKQEYNKLNSAMLDLAEGAGLIKPEVRKSWQSEWYVPFYRQDIDGEGLMGPRTSRGLSHQSSGIKALKGGDVATEDLLSNILTNWMKLADASMKNMALLKTVDNLKDTEYMSDESLKYTQAIIPKAEVNKRIKSDRKYLAMVAEMLGVTTVSEMKVAEQLAKLDSTGFEKLWAITAPTDPNVIRVQREGKNEYYRVNEEVDGGALLRGLVHLSNPGNQSLLLKGGRFFKRLLTTGITSSPDFMIRNFVRDGAHAWAINKDGFTFGKDTLKGMVGAFKQDPDYRELMFANASFQGGYVHGTDPEASEQIRRRALEKKGLTRQQINNHTDSILDYGGKGWHKMQKGWQTYREAGDKLENSNRLATFKAAKKSGKSLAQAIYESKDLMDYSLRGNYAAMNVLTDVVPFLNARLQGLSKLGRAAEFKGDIKKPWTWRTDKQVAIAIGKIALFSAALALWNDDDERYQELPDWEKDAYWHIMLEDKHFRIPKPFEIGIIAGTIPERMMHTWILDNQPDDKLLWSLKHGTLETLGFNPIPQAVLPVIELWGNKSYHFGTPIESMTDQRKRPQDRHNAHTSETAIFLGELTGQSPKQLQHLWKGYTGTMGAYVLSSIDVLAAMAQGKPNQGELLPTDIPVLKSFYRGENPHYSTQYTSDLYNRLKEVNQLAASLKEMKGGERREFLAENRDKLRYKKLLARFSKRLRLLRKRRDAIMESKTLNPKNKQAKLDAIQEKINLESKRAINRTEDAF